ncbi:MAG: DUF6814 family protein [Flavisolibacter sp.]
MDKLKRTLGILWMVIGLASILLLIYSAAININSAKGDIGKPVPWIIIIVVFTPIALGLMLFGWYAFKGAYDGEIKT